MTPLQIYSSVSQIMSYISIFNEADKKFFDIWFNNSSKTICNGFRRIIKYTSYANSQIGNLETFWPITLLIWKDDLLAEL